MLTVTQAADRLKVTSDTLYNWHKAGKIHIIVESDRRRFISIEEIERIEANKIPDGMKRCNECGGAKLKALFISDRNICKGCAPVVNQKEWEANKEKRNETRKTKYHENKERFQINERKYKYNITQDEYEVMLEKANGVCIICQRITDKFCIDHDHFTGKVRGLICANCNFGLGHFNDSVLELQNAINYLNYHHDKKSYCGYFYGGC